MADIRSDRCSAIRKLVSDTGRHQCSGRISGVRLFRIQSGLPIPFCQLLFSFYSLLEGSNLQVEIVSVRPFVRMSSLQHFQYRAFKYRPHILCIPLPGFRSTQIFLKENLSCHDLNILRIEIFSDGMCEKSHISGFIETYGSSSKSLDLLAADILLNMSQPCCKL